MCAELRHCQWWVTNGERQRVPQWRTRDAKTSLSVSRRSWSRYRQIVACCRSEMTSASGGRNRVVHHLGERCRLVQSGVNTWNSADGFCTPCKRRRMGSQCSRSRMSLVICGRISVCAVSVEPLRSARSVVAGYELHAHRRWHCYSNQYDLWQTHVTWRRLQLVTGKQSSAVVDGRSTSTYGMTANPLLSCADLFLFFVSFSFSDIDRALLCRKSTLDSRSSSMHS